MNSPPPASCRLAALNVLALLAKSKPPLPAESHVDRGRTRVADRSRILALRQRRSGPANRRKLHAGPGRVGIQVDRILQDQRRVGVGRTEHQVAGKIGAELQGLQGGQGGRRVQGHRPRRVMFALEAEKPTTSAVFPEEPRLIWPAVGVVAGGNHHVGEVCGEAALGSRPSVAPISRIDGPAAGRVQADGGQTVSVPPLPKALWFRSERIDRPPLVLLDTVTSPGGSSIRIGAQENQLPVERRSWGRYSCWRHW